MLLFQERENHDRKVVDETHTISGRRPAQSESKNPERKLVGFLYSKSLKVS